MNDTVHQADTDANKKRISKRFKKIYIEITNRCNLACPFCVVSEKPAKVMDISDFRKVIEHIHPFGDFLFFHVLGEPLLHPHLDILFETAGQYGKKINLTTNGLLLEKWKSCIKHQSSLRQINISLHSKGGNTDDEAQAAYLSLMIDTARELAEKSHIIISLRIWNLGCEDAVEQRFNKKVLDLLRKQYPETTPADIPGVDKQGYLLADRIYLNLDQRFEWPDIHCRIRTVNGFCRGLRDQVAILADGTVVPCCLDVNGIMELGNIFREDLGRILQTDRAVRIFNGFSEHKAVEELCIHCHYKSRFEHQKPVR